MEKGYYVGYSYAGLMPDGTVRYFATEKEYLEAYKDALKETG